MARHPLGPHPALGTVRGGRKRRGRELSGCNNRLSAGFAAEAWAPRQVARGRRAASAHDSLRGPRILRCSRLPTAPRAASAGVGASLCRCGISNFRLSAVRWPRVEPWLLRARCCAPSFSGRGPRRLRRSATPCSPALGLSSLLRRCPRRKAAAPARGFHSPSPRKGARTSHCSHTATATPAI